MSSRPWMPLYVADYRADTAHLSTLENGAYLLLIMHYWQTGGLPDDDQRLARIAGLPIEQWLSIRSTVVQFFSPGWKHKRIEFELTEASRRSLQARAAGKKSAESKKARTTVELPLNDRSNGTSTERQRLQSQLQSQEKEDSVATATASDPRAELFKRGPPLLAELTGRTPDSCRSLIGKWLKAAQDEAIHVLAALDDAKRNHILDPTSWITGRLNKQFQRGQDGKRTVQDAARDLHERIVKFNDERHLLTGNGSGARADIVRLLPERRSG